MATCNKTKKQKFHLPPASIVTRMIPHDQMSAGCAMYGFTSTSGDTYGNVPHFLSNIRSLPFSLQINFSVSHHEKSSKRFHPINPRESRMYLK